MIPKIIHYCWFGPKAVSEEAKTYIRGWKLHCPDYKIICWSEDNFDISANQYVKEAYESKKYAFVTDYVRLFVLYKFGGIYMDTDVEMCKNMDALLHYPAFSGYESDSGIVTGTMAAEKGNVWIGLLLKDYDDIHFVRPNGTMDIMTNTFRITETTLKNYDVELNGKVLTTKDFVILPFEYLCAKSWENGEIYKTDNTYTIHHFANSWQSDKMKTYGKIRRAIKKSSNPIARFIDKFMDIIVNKIKKG